MPEISQIESKTDAVNTLTLTLKNDDIQRFKWILRWAEFGTFIGAKITVNRTAMLIGETDVKETDQTKKLLKSLIEAFADEKEL